MKLAGALSGLKAKGVLRMGASDQQTDQAGGGEDGAPKGHQV
jgi:hypothetical protein